jgi:FkbM family methyltransferase
MAPAIAPTARETPMTLPQATMLLRAAAPNVKVVDIGAMHVGKDHQHAKLLKAGKAEVIGFEPVAEACAKLNDAAAGTPQRYLPYAIGDGSTREFRETNAPMTSSLYEPNTPLLEKFQALAELTIVVSRTPIETKRLDDIPEVADADYLKLDVQGGELDILRGAARVLASVTVVHTEVNFVPMYKDQPLFADIDAELRKHGFLLHKLHSLAGRAFKPFVQNNNVGAMISQHLWGDAVYVRDFMRLDALTPAQVLKLALIVHETYVSYDLAAYALRAYDQMTGKTLGADFMTAITAK